MSARNNSFSLNFQSKKMKEKLREIELTRASISLLQLNLSKNIACSPAHTHNIFSEKFHEMRQKNHGVQRAHGRKKYYSISW
jgi:hypothetical protein